MKSKRAEFDLVYNGGVVFFLYTNLKYLGFSCTIETELLLNLPNKVRIASLPISVTVVCKHLSGRVSALNFQLKFLADFKAFLFPFFYFPFSLLMIDHLTIFTKGGLVLWSYTQATIKGSPIDSLIRTALVEERSGENSFNFDQYSMKWTFANEFDLTFVVNNVFFHNLNYYSLGCLSTHSSVVVFG